LRALTFIIVSGGSKNPRIADLQPERSRERKPLVLEFQCTRNLGCRRENKTSRKKGLMRGIEKASHQNPASSGAACGMGGVYLEDHPSQ